MLWTFPRWVFISWVDLCFWDPNSVRFARGVHGLGIKGGFDTNAHIRSELVSMCARLNCTDSGYRVFTETSNPDLTTWSAVITGFFQIGKCKEAFALFREMNESSIKIPDHVLIASILSACASLSTIVPGLRAFERMPHKDPIAYNTIISGLGSNGSGVEAIKLFNKMLEDRFKPNKATFSGILCACAPSGLLEEGSNMFKRMRAEFKMSLKWSIMCI